MINKTGFITVLSLFVFLGCGGSSDSSSMSEPQITATATSQKKLELTIDNITINSDSNLSRVSSIISQNKQLVQMFQFNKEVTIEIKGKDAEKFYFHDNPSQKRYDLFFHDVQFEGEFEIDIHASSDGETIIYKVKYIVQESISRKLLLDQTLYFIAADEARNETYKTYNFSDEIVTIKELDFKTDELTNENTVKILYLNDYIVSNLFKSTNDSQQCKIRHINNQYALHYHSMELSCLYGDTRSYGDNHYMKFNKDDAIKDPHFYISDLEVSTTLITNHENISTPKIKSFSFTGNYVKEDNKTATISNRRNSPFRISVMLDNALSNNQKAYLFFHNNADNISNIGNHLELKNTGKSISLVGRLIDSKLNKFKYFLDGSSEIIDDSNKFNTFPEKGYLNLFVCKNSISLNSCHHSSIPVKFKE